MAVPNSTSTMQVSKRKLSEIEAGSQPLGKRTRKEPPKPSHKRHELEANEQSGPPLLLQTTPPTVPELLDDDLLTSLRRNYEVRILSVIGSTNMANRIDSILQHLGRFHPTDLSVKPGVVLLFAKPKDTNKLISVLERCKKCIEEANQRYFQYNKLNQKEVEGPASSALEVSRIEETVLPDDDAKRGSGDDSGEDYFESMPPTFERALEPKKANYTKYFSTFLSRVPLKELEASGQFTLQETNDGRIRSL
jgi:hypothetical protein